ncbi:MAG: tRNA uridine-5-carboxymethylaminomethyl(34) synthesis GTPase MnmE [Hyphomicrobiales bacterium]|nr:tRNA uridine-5-carboxymethylaminomethyl(34) synthesis GTPase MnmE [Hyphomicrobiales bacterium]MDE2016141.1 tRNA uridine-5-carboxymethylaminomethyl(34) synthesis GTPase MnmE [Hyphomicrobiales bacterium]
MARTTQKTVGSRDTIHALSTAPFRSAVAVVRVSGPATRRVVDALAGPLPAPRRAVLRRIVDPVDAALIDEGLVLWMPGPASFTGEDMAEFHVHGGMAVVARLLSAVGSVPTCRSAEAGEFARRAFEHGRLDLSRLEGIADLVDAHTEAQRRMALRLADGAVAREADAIRAGVLEAMVLVEADLDFADEGDVTHETISGVVERCSALLARLEAALQGATGAARLRDGLTVAITGPPNVGKSTLINALSRREVAIVSPLPGTTRDSLEAWIDLDGLPVCLIDTAGLRDSDDPIEREGIRRARARAEAADAILVLSDGDHKAEAFGEEVRAIRVRTKCDLGLPSGGDDTTPVLLISARSGYGLDALRQALAAKLRDGLAGGETALLSQERHRLAFQRSAESLRLTISDRTRPLEVIAEDLRVVATAMGRVTGRIDVEDILGDIFSRFCIGK